MSDANSIREVKQKFYKSISQDGIADIISGIAIMIVAYPPFQSIFTVSFCFGLIYLIKPIRKKVIRSRIGYVDDNSQNILKRLPKTVLFSLYLLIFLALLGLVKALQLYLPSIVESNFPILYGVVLAIIPLVFAVITNIKRLYFYSALIFLMFLSAIFLNIKSITGVECIIAAGERLVFLFGSIVGITGAVIFGRFLKDNPVIENNVLQSEDS